MRRTGISPRLLLIGIVAAGCLILFLRNIDLHINAGNSIRSSINKIPADSPSVFDDAVHHQMHQALALELATKQQEHKEEVEKKNKLLEDREKEIEFREGKVALAEEQFQIKEKELKEREDKIAEVEALQKVTKKSSKSSSSSADSKVTSSSIPCPVNANQQLCSGSGECDGGKGVCKCVVGRVGKSCEFEKKVYENSNLVVPFSVIVYPSELARTSIPSFKARYPNVPVLYSEDDAKLEQEALQGNMGKGFESLNRQLHKVKTPLVFVSFDILHYKSLETDFALAVNMIVSTDVDILGGLTYQHELRQVDGQP